MKALWRQGQPTMTTVGKTVHTSHGAVQMQTAKRLPRGRWEAVRAKPRLVQHTGGSHGGK